MTRLKTALDTALVALTLAAAGAAHAEAPQAKGQAPGWYRTALGNFETPASNDGTVSPPMDKLQFDTDSKAAMPQRQKNDTDAAKKGYYVAVAHVAFPGIGRLRADGKGYAWVPANYSNAGEAGK